MAEVRKKELKKCRVCGDHALGSNFNAITCESCKAFFRRNALKTKDFKCPFDNNCKVDVITRRFCQKCRLKKCFDIGMKKEWIMTDEEKRAKRRKIEKNRLKKGNQQDQDTYTSAELVVVKVESPDPVLNNVLLSPASSMSPQTPGSVGVIAEPQKTRLFGHQPLTPSDCEYSPLTEGAAVDGLEDIRADTLSQVEMSPGGVGPSGITSNVSLHRFKENDSQSSEENYLKCCRGCSLSSPSSNCSKCHSTHPKSKFSSESNHTTPRTDAKGNSSRKKRMPEFENALNCSSESNNEMEPESSTDLPDSVYAKAVSIEFTELPIREMSSDCRDLSALEKQKINELVVANAVLKMPLACGINDPSLLDVINMTDHAIRRLIKMSKKIEAFKNLCQTDQIALLKGSCTELMILRSVMSYDPEKECWRGPHGPKRMSIKVDILKEAKGNVYEEHKRFINSFQPHWRTDENIMLILSGIALFTPERPNTVHKEVIKLEQDTYYYLLRRYLESIYSMCEAKSSYLRLIHKIQELHILNENHVRVYLDVNPKDVEPLLIEIFDLKN